MRRQTSASVPNHARSMSALGQKRTFLEVCTMSVLPPESGYHLSTLGCPLSAKSRRHPTASMTTNLIDCLTGISARSCSPRRERSPAIWRCTWARPRANVTAKWRMNRRTVATIVVRDHIIDLRTSISRAMMMFGCGPCWECGAKNYCNRKRNFYFA